MKLLRQQDQHISGWEWGGNEMKQETNIQLAVPESNTGPCIPGDKVLQLYLIYIVSDELSRITLCIQ